MAGKMLPLERLDDLGIVDRSSETKVRVAFMINLESQEERPVILAPFIILLSG